MSYGADGYGLPVGVYTLENGRGVAANGAYSFGEPEAVADLMFDSSLADLFVKGTGYDGDWGALVAPVDGSGVQLGDSSPDGRVCTDYRFGLFRVELMRLELTAPVTGGSGVAAFYIAGGALLAGGSALLTVPVTRKRKRSEA